MTPQQMMDRINQLTSPDRMTKVEAYDWLSELSSLLDGQIDALESEIAEEGDRGQ